MTLSNLVPGQTAKITAIVADYPLRCRLSALGFRIGNYVHLIRRGTGSGPFHIRIGNTDVMMRQTEAELISVDQITS